VTSVIEPRGPALTQPALPTWDIAKAIKYLVSHASDRSKGLCALYVRLAVEAGGVKIERHISAKDYGSSLVKVGFKAIGQIASGFAAGDVAIIQAIEGHPHGHMTMFAGSIWISDFKQQHGLYPGPLYRKLRPRYTVYRFPGLTVLDSRSQFVPVGILC